MTLSDSSPRAVSIRIGTSRLRAPRRTARHNDTPSRPGSITSSTSRSYAFGLGALQRGLAVAGTFAGVALEAEVQAHQLADVRLVFDDEHARRVGHSFFTACPRPAFTGAPSNLLEGDDT